MSDADNGWEGLDVEDYGDYLGGGTSEGLAPNDVQARPIATGPLVSPLSMGVGSSSSPRRGEPPLPPGAGTLQPPSQVQPPAASPALRGLGRFGDFTPTAVCELRSLSRIAYLFFWNVANGDTMKALTTLGIYRNLYNSARHTIATGFSATAQAALPATLPEAAWTTPMATSMALALSAALGSSNTAMTAALNALPLNMAALAGWFPQFRSALRPEDSSISIYANTPTSGDWGTSIGAAIRDDLQACISPPAPAPTPSPATYSVATQGPAPVSASQTYTQPAPGPAPTPTSASGPGASAVVRGPGGSLVTVALVGLVAFGAWKIFQEETKKPTPKLAGLETDLLGKAKRAAKADAPKMACFPTAKARTEVSMDELAGRRGEKLAEMLAKLPPKEAQPAEDAYFAELDRLRPGAPRCV